ncbi:tetratricopeptide repeat protein [Neisseriaceae bacterium B1]
MNNQAFIIMVSITLLVSLIVYISWLKAVKKKLNYGLLIIPAIILLTAVGYFVLGNPLATDPSERFANNGNVEQFVNAVESLEKKAASEPDNLEHQIMLAHSYRAMGKYDQSVAAFGKSWEKIKDNSDELTLFAGTLAVWRGEFNGKPDELLDMALKLNPENIDALMLAGGSAFQKQNYAQAIQIWKKIPIEKLGEDDKKWLQQQIQDTQDIINKSQAEAN